VLKVLEQARADGLTVPVVPMGLSHLWGSFFSRIELRGGEPTAMVRPFRRGIWSRVGLQVGPALSAEGLTLDVLRERVEGLVLAP